MYTAMEICIYGYMDKWIYGYMHAYKMNIVMEICIYGYMHMCIYGYMDIWIYGCMDVHFSMTVFIYGYMHVYNRSLANVVLEVYYIRSLRLALLWPGQASTSGWVARTVLIGPSYTFKKDWVHKNKC